MADVHVQIRVSTTALSGYIIMLGMRRPFHMTIAMVAVLLILRPLDCFSMPAMSQEAAECCRKGHCDHKGASEDNCCKADTRGSSSLYTQSETQDFGGPVPVLVALVAQPTASMFCSSRAQFFAADRSLPGSPPGYCLNLPLLI